MKTAKILILAIAAFLCVLGIYWLSGSDFERGQPLALAVTLGLVVAGIVAGVSHDS